MSLSMGKCDAGSLVGLGSHFFCRRSSRRASSNFWNLKLVRTHSPGESFTYSRVERFGVRVTTAFVAVGEEADLSIAPRNLFRLCLLRSYRYQENLFFVSSIYEACWLYTPNYSFGVFSGTVEALLYNLESHRFDSQWSRWIFHWLCPFGRTVVPVLTLPLTEMSTGDIS